MKKWIYFGIFLDEESKESLRLLSDKIVDKSWKLFCHHMTIAFNNGTDEAQKEYDKYKDRFGEVVEIYATHIGISDDAIAVKIDFKPGTLTNFPHVTIATPKGGKPVKSNYITNWKPLSDYIKLSGKISAFY